jgi:hypothetical protein
MHEKKSAMTADFSLSLSRRHESGWFLVKNVASHGLSDLSDLRWLKRLK